MKKFVLTVLVIMFSLLSANATDVIRYNNAGVPVSISRNMGLPMNVTRIPNHTTIIMQNHGIAHPARPAMPALPTMTRGRCPYYNNPMAYRRPPRIMNYNFPTPVHPMTTVSRLNKNSTANVPKRSYTMNGVTYYD